MTGASQQRCVNIKLEYLFSDFATSLGCAAAAAAACSLTLSPRQTLELTCICAGQLCNAPFSAQLRNELLNFSYPNANESALTEAFFKLSNFANVSGSVLYKTITVDATPTIMPVRNSSEVVTLSSMTAGEVTPRAETTPLVVVMPRAEEMPRAIAMPRAETMPRAEIKPRAEAMPRAEAIPRAEALKQQATVPSDDDEDESEGSGAYEDSRSHIQSHSASAPAAPSSYLPAEENKAVHLSPNLLLLPILLFCTLA